MVRDKVWYGTKYGTGQSMVRDKVWYGTKYGTGQSMVRDKVWFGTKFEFTFQHLIEVFAQKWM